MPITFTYNSNNPNSDTGASVTNKVKAVTFTIADLLASLVGVSITQYTCLTYIGEACRNRLMSFNLADYTLTYSNLLPYDYNVGQNTITYATRDGETQYTEVHNVQWNDNDSSEVAQDDNIYSSLTNPRSLLNKTKRLFMENQMDTIVARFHTEGNLDPFHNKTGASTVYGMSHGRNLLTKDAESGNNSRKTNGYDNPYCRVWTHHHQYDSIDKLIRPFIEDGSPTPIGDLQAPWTFIRGNYGAKRLGDNTVLNKNGFVNIAPSYNPNEDLKVHTKQCMFSIENLAWKGYTKHDFENTLSWEQRGPLGGRIMWFPPYDISFSENTDVQWNEDSFIGRGEKVYTYVDTTRTGVLHFKILVDHPSIINYYEGNTNEQTIEQSYQINPLYTESVRQYNAQNLQNQLNAGFGNEGGPVTETVVKRTQGEPKDTDLLRFFAGCDTIEGKAKNLTDETMQEEPATEPEEPASESPATEQSKPIQEEEKPSEGEFIFYVYYPNNYSGQDDPPGSTVEAMAYLLNGIVCQKESDGTTDGMLKFADLRNHLIDSGVGTGFEMSTTDGISHLYTEDGPYGYMDGTYMDWQYRVDMSTINQRLLRKDNEIDHDLADVEPYNAKNNGLNIDRELGYGWNVENIQDKENKIFSFAEVAYALSGIGLIRQKGSVISGFDDRVQQIKDILENYEISKVTSHGFANDHGNNASQSRNISRNNDLAKNRGKSVMDWLKTLKPFSDMPNDSEHWDERVFSVEDVQTETQNVSAIKAKMLRACKIVVNYKLSDTTTLAETDQQQTIQDANSGVTQFQEDKLTKMKTVGGYEIAEFYDRQNNKKIYYRRQQGTNDVWEMFDLASLGESGQQVETTTVTRENDFNNIRYDQEYHFFKVLEDRAPITFKKLTDKIKYFNPAFHSITPEGFSARLNFLQQCCRQGNTVGASSGTENATNLAFGRAPYCVLRLGDFYYTKIVINNMSWSFDPLVWDLNSEGIGVQPLIADINISFTFIGGSDIKGPIARLQNAMTFNYLANTSVYDNRADTVEYDEDGNEKNYQAHVVPLSSK